MKHVFLPLTCVLFGALITPCSSILRHGEAGLVSVIRGREEPANHASEGHSGEAPAEEEHASHDEHPQSQHHEGEEGAEHAEHAEHHGHDEHAEHHEEHGAHSEDAAGEHGHHPPSELAICLSVMLLAAVAFVMSIFYLVNHPNKHIQGYTWKIISMTMSIFCAVLLYGMVHLLLVDAFSYFRGSHPTEAQIAYIHLGSFLVLWVCLQACLWLLQGNMEDMKALSTILAHLVGFAAMYGFAGLQSLEFVRDSYVKVVGVIVLALVVGLALSAVASFVREKIASADGVVSETEEEWEEAVEEAEDDAGCLCIGFIIMQSIRMFITGHMQPIEAHHEQAYRNPAQIMVLAIICVALTIVVFFGTSVINKLDQPGSKGIFHKAAKFWHHVFGMTLAYCLVYLGEWMFKMVSFDGPRISASMIVAIVMTFFSCMCTFTLNHIAVWRNLKPKALRSLIMAFGLLVGFLWERAFDIALIVVAEQPNIPLSHGWAATVLTVLLVGVVLPAWKAYIMPLAEDDSPHETRENIDKKAEEKRLSLMVKA